MRTIPIVLAAGVVAEYAVSARYFRLMSTVGPVDVDLMQRGAVVYEATSVEAGFYAIPDGGFNSIRIRSAAAQVVQFAVSNGDGGYDRTVGSVSVVPREGGDLLYGPGFVVAPHDIAAIVGNNGIAQLFNPVGSGVRLFVDQISVRSAVAMGFSLSVVAGAATTLVSAIGGASKISGGAVSLSQLRRDQTAIGVIFGNLMITGQPDTVPRLPYKFSSPLIITPGNGLNIIGLTFNTAFSVYPEWREGV